MLTLAQIPIGQKAVIVSLDPFPLRERLYELGFLPGEEIILKKIAPFGDPMEVFLLGYNLCLRKKDAQKIWVKIL